MMSFFIFNFPHLAVPDYLYGLTSGERERERDHITLCRRLIACDKWLQQQSANHIPDSRSLARCPISCSSLPHLNFLLNGSANINASGTTATSTGAPPYSSTTTRTVGADCECARMRIKTHTTARPTARMLASRHQTAVMKAWEVIRWSMMGSWDGDEAVARAWVVLISSLPRNVEGLLRVRADCRVG